MAHDYAACSDAELLKLHVGGDSNAFSELFLRHKDRLWAVAIRTLSDPEEAADALQDAMISAFRRAGSFRGESAVTTWLHRIVVNACLDRMRRRSTRPEVVGGNDRLLEMITSDAAGADHAAASETSIEVMAALRELPRDQQVAIVLVDMLDYPVADAAEVLGVALGTVKSRCARGRARLLPKLAHLRPSAAREPPAAGKPTAAAAGHVWPATVDSAPSQVPSADRGQLPASGRSQARADRDQAPAADRGQVPAAGPSQVPAAGQGHVPAAAARSRTSAPRSGTTDGPENSAYAELSGVSGDSGDSERGERNRFPPGSVLPAKEGGEEEE